MTKKGWARFDKIMRSIHLYIALFLAPWLLMYATSAFFLNHNDWFRDLFDVISPSWAIEQEQDFKPSEISSSTPQLTAQNLLSRLDLKGDYQLLAESNNRQLVILRYSGAGNYRITWQSAQGKAVVERYVPISMYGFLHYLHFKSGFERKQLASDIWAIIVDFVAISIWMWVISGLYLWIRRRKKQHVDILIFGSGITAFALLVMSLYS